MMMDANQYALVTGGTSGIGLELARLLAKDRYNLVIVARSPQELETVSAQIRDLYAVDVVTIEKDLFDQDAPFQVYQEVKAKGIVVDVLINNAGQGVYGEFKDTDLDRELDIVQLNITTCIVLTKYFLKDMLARNKGKILNTSSIAGKVPGPYQAVYHGTKAFVHFFSEAIRSEVKGTGVTVTSLLPGATDTDFFHKADMESSKVVQGGELADPADVAKDGYKAMMDGKDMVISGFKNKMQIAMNSVLPDGVATDTMRKMQEPADKHQ